MAPAQADNIAQSNSQASGSVHAAPRPSTPALGAVVTPARRSDVCGVALGVSRASARDSNAGSNGRLPSATTTAAGATQGRRGASQGADRAWAPQRPVV